MDISGKDNEKLRYFYKKQYFLIQKKYVILRVILPYCGKTATDKKIKLKNI